MTFDNLSYLLSSCHTVWYCMMFIVILRCCMILYDVLCNVYVRCDIV